MINDQCYLCTNLFTFIHIKCANGIVNILLLLHRDIFIKESDFFKNKIAWKSAILRRNYLNSLHSRPQCAKVCVNDASSKCNDQNSFIKCVAWQIKIDNKLLFKTPKNDGMHESKGIRRRMGKIYARNIMLIIITSIPTWFISWQTVCIDSGHGVLDYWLLLFPLSVGDLLSVMTEQRVKLLLYCGFIHFIGEICIGYEHGMHESLIIASHRKWMGLSLANTSDCLDRHSERTLRYSAR